MNNCDRINKLLSLYIDNELSAKKSAYVKEHIKHCKDCAKEHDMLIMLAKEIKTESVTKLPQDFHEKLHMRLAKECVKTENSRLKIPVPFGRYSIVAIGLILVLLVGTKYYNNFNDAKIAYIDDTPLKIETDTQLKGVGNGDVQNNVELKNDEKPSTTPEKIDSNTTANTAYGTSTIAPTSTQAQVSTALDTPNQTVSPQQDIAYNEPASGGGVLAVVNETPNVLSDDTAVPSAPQTTTSPQAAKDIADAAPPRFSAVMSAKVQNNKKLVTIEVENIDRFIADLGEGYTIKNEGGQTTIYADDSQFYLILNLAYKINANVIIGESSDTTINVCIIKTK